MLTLSPRLQACAAYVTTGGCACDVGTDHAYLPVYLVQNGQCRQVIAADISSGPLGHAKQIVERYGMGERIPLCQSDGLLQVPDAGLTDVIVAGMGGETICGILGAVDWLQRGTNLVLQPMTKAAVLRLWLAAHGFETLQEIAVQEEQHFYPVLQARYTGIMRTLTPLQAELGAMQPAAPSVSAYAAVQAARFAKQAAGLRQAGRDAAETEQLAAAFRQIAEGKDIVWQND